jgi:hypothetical protein
MNQEKHKKNLVQEWLSGEEIMTPTKARGSPALTTLSKMGGAGVRRRGPVLPAADPREERRDAAVRREPGRAVVGHAAHAAASWDHLQKQKHLGRMRASFEYRPVQRCAEHARPLAAALKQPRKGQKTSARRVR